MTGLHHGFRIERQADVPEINSTATLYTHVKSGARLLSLVNEDENKVFGINFRTPPEDSTGVAHIMEHSVLCGSRKYPLKEPFVELIKGSMKTFLNAFTMPDKTCYPVASTNTKDFYNLADVYMDAVLHPLIPEKTLLQEGWHFELDEPEGELVYKGVVFNEMKGAYSSPDGLLHTRSRQSLFPDQTYGHDSGGQPEAILDLTYAQFKGFHERYYHPSNAYIYFYGDDDPEQRLQFLDAYLSEFDRVDPASEVPLQPKFDTPRTFEFLYDMPDPEAGSKKGMVTLNWMLDESQDPEEGLALDILTHLLIGNQAAPLRKALIDSGLGENLVGGGLEDQLRQMSFSVGLKGINPQDGNAVEALILQTLSTLADEGFDRLAVEASLNTTEFRLRELNTGGFPRGLVLMIWALAAWAYERDPIEPLYFEAPLASIKARLAAGEAVFEILIRKYLLENLHRTRVLLRPDAQVGAAVQEAESERLREARLAMDQQEVLDLVDSTEALRKWQARPDDPDDLARLPFLSLADLDPKNTQIPLENQKLGGVDTYYHDLFTNGIVYFDLGFDLSGVGPELLPYLALFSRAIFGMGTRQENYVSLTQRIGRKTGGVGGSRLLSSSFADPNGVAWFFIRGKGTVAQTPDLLDIISDVIVDLKLDDQERFLQLALEAKARKEAGLIPGGHGIVNTRLKAHFSPSSRAAEAIGGLSNLFFTRALVDEIQNDWPGVHQKLEAIRIAIFNGNHAIANATVDGQSWKSLQPAVADFLGGLPRHTQNRPTWQFENLPDNEGLTMPSQVNYVGKGANLYDLGYESHGAAMVARRYLGTTWLWEKIRVQGGAYGGLSSFGRMSGTFTYLSYRDPNLLKTLDNYDGAGYFLSQADIPQSELTKTIIGTISDFDSYQLPDSKGYTSLLRKLTAVSESNRQQLRDEILTTTVADIHKFGEALIRLNDVGHVVVLGSPDSITEANEARGGDWLNIRKVL
jgi:hypothetical protein